MATAPTTKQPLTLLLEVIRNPDSRVEGQMRLAPTDPGWAFSGVLELLKILEDCLDRHESGASSAAQTDKDTR